jgi:hypothetical protein
MRIMVMNPKNYFDYHKQSIYFNVVHVSVNSCFICHVGESTLRQNIMDITKYILKVVKFSIVVNSNLYVPMM